MMKIYSDELGSEDLCKTTPFGVECEIEEMRNTRLRAHGWKVRLTGSSTRHRNSGTHGADIWDSSPATWDEHGQWMATLYELDPNMIVSGYYHNAQEFHYSTQNKYRR